MQKDSQAKLGRTKCDYCDRPAIQADGKIIVCEQHATANTAAGVKQGSVRGTPLKSAGTIAADLHS